MKTRFWILPLALLNAMGCIHTTAVAPAKASEERARTDRADGAKLVRTNGAKPARTAMPAHLSAPGNTELSSSPDGLMVADGPAQVQKALEQRGYLSNHQTGTFDEMTTKALKNFQTDENLAKTGAPDRETMRRLGLKPEKLFRATKS